jgi:Tc toxin complex TcA C-terminal TcB-binding domain
LHDDRYLPFEFRGVVSRWRIELPHENNYFPMNSLSDLILHLNYTSREGGEPLRRAASEAAERELPGEGWCFFDLRQDFSDAWELFRRNCGDREGGRNDHKHRDQGDGQDHQHGEHREEPCLMLCLNRSMFPFEPGGRELNIEKMALLFNRCEHCGCECPEECPCCMDPTPASHDIRLESERRREHQRFRCPLSEHWPGLYHGVIETRIGPLRSDRERTQVKFCFPESVCCVTEAYLLCRYSLEERCPRRKEPSPLECNPCE